MIVIHTQDKGLLEILSEKLCHNLMRLLLLHLAWMETQVDSLPHRKVVLGQVILTLLQEK